MKDAKIYLAGSIFDGVSEMKTLFDFQDYLHGYLLRNGLAAAAPAVYLEKDRFGRAGLFLESGYDVIPADSEPFQIAMAALDDAGRPEPPSEFIFGFGDEIPSRFLERLQGRVRRTLLTIGGEAPPAYADAYLDVSAVLSFRPEEPAAAPKSKQPVIVPLPPREPTPPKRPAAAAKPQEPAPAAAPVQTRPAAATSAAPVKKPAAPEPAPPAKAPAKTAVQTAPKTTEAKPQAAPKTEPKTPAGAVEPIRHYDRPDRLLHVQGTEDVQLGIDVKECFAQLTESFESPEGKIPLSELAASVRAQIPGMKNASDFFVQSLLPEDFRCIEDGGNLTVLRTDRPELDSEPVPAKVGAWLLENDLLLDSNVTEIVSDRSEGVPLAEIADEIKSRYPILENTVSEEWLASHLPRGISSFKSPGGPVTIRVEVQPMMKPSSLYPDFETVSRRAALMKDYCRWMGGEKRKKASQSERDRKKADLFARAAELFVNMSAIPASTPDEDFGLYADCYEALEVSARMLAAGMDGKLVPTADLSQLGQCCADAICLIKTALLERGFDLHAEGVQHDAYDELNKFTKQYRVFLQNMKFDDRINTDDRKDIRDQFIAMEKRLTRQDVSKKRKSLLSTIEYHLNKIREALPGEVYDWNKVVAGITQLVQECGVPPTSDEIKGYLRPFIGKFPEEINKTDTFIRIIQKLEVDADPDAQRRSSYAAARDQKISNGVRKVRKAYKGTKLVFIGGTPQPHIIERIKSAFLVDEVIWDEVSHGDSLDRFQSVLNDEAVRLILVYIPWCSHKHSEDFAKIAEAAGKDFVRVPKGTNPELLAAAICEQVGLK